MGAFEEDDLPDELREDVKRLELSLDDLRGMAEDAVRRICEINGYKSRVTRRNGTPCTKTADFNLKRINLHVEYNVVVKAMIG